MEKEEMSTDTPTWNKKHLRAKGWMQKKKKKNNCFSTMKFQWCKQIERKNKRTNPKNLMESFFSFILKVKIKPKLAENWNQDYAKWCKANENFVFDAMMIEIGYKNSEKFCQQTKRFAFSCFSAFRSWFINSNEE